MHKRQDRVKKFRLYLERDLESLEELVHPVTGATLYLAKTRRPVRFNKAETYDPCYIVGWAAPGKKTIHITCYYSEKAEAKAGFKDEKQAGPPQIPTIMRDFQVAQVYAWERRMIDKHSPGNLSLEQMERVVKRISDDFNMVAPHIDYRHPHPHQRKNAASFYMEDPHEITMKHRKLSFVIHEVAHAIDAHINGNKWAAHGPSFVRTLIRLAERYQFWHDAGDLEKTAKDAGILVAPDDALPPIPRP